MMVKIVIEAPLSCIEFFYLFIRSKPKKKSHALQGKDKNVYIADITLKEFTWPFITFLEKKGK